VKRDGAVLSEDKMLRDLDKLDGNELKGVCVCVCVCVCVSVCERVCPKIDQTD